jgi:hypothetical protein
MDLFRRVLNYRVTVEALIETAMWLALPYVVIGLVWAFLHAEQLRELQTRWETVLPAGSDVVALVEATALWPAMLLITDACPA